jgi:hypothetical protein
MTDPTPKSLDEQLAELARDVVPPRQLWNGIVYGIARKHRNARPIALAAAAACAILTSALFWVVLHERGGSTGIPLIVSTNRAAGTGAATTGVPTGGAAVSLAVTDEPLDAPLDAKYMATRTRLEATFHERLTLLDPKTRAQIESSLAVIQRAHQDIRKALAAEPANPVLEQLFESTWHDEFDLYDHVVRATQPSLSRT